MNWKKVIRDLEKKGLTQTQIAAHCESSQPYISQLRSRVRKRPSYDMGRRLIALHQKLCGGPDAAQT